MWPLSPPCTGGDWAPRIRCSATRGEKRPPNGQGIAPGRWPCFWQFLGSLGRPLAPQVVSVVARTLCLQPLQPGRHWV